MTSRRIREPRRTGTVSTSTADKFAATAQVMLAGENEPVIAVKLAVIDERPSATSPERPDLGECRTLVAALLEIGASRDVRRARNDLDRRTEPAAGATAGEEDPAHPETTGDGANDAHAAVAKRVHNPWAVPALVG